MEFNVTTMQQYHGQWIRCESLYGTHHGLVSHILEHGILLAHAVQLSSFEGNQTNDIQTTPYARDSAAQEPMLQFFPGPIVPAPGLFVPYGAMLGVYGMRPGLYW